MTRVSRLFRALALAAAYLLAVEGVVASAAASAHAGRMASAEGGAVWCGPDPASTEPGALGACDDLCRLAVAAVPPAAPPAARSPATRSTDALEPGRTTEALGAPRRSSLPRGPPASARRA